MRHFKHIFNNPPQHLSNHIDEGLSERGWFDCPSSTASIHPIFGKHMFCDVDFDDLEDASFTKTERPISNSFYNNLRPALRLASAMFERSRDYWAFIMKAPIYYYPEENIERVGYGYVDQGLPGRRRRVNPTLVSMSKSTQICWFNPDDPGEIGYGVTDSFYVPSMSDRESKLRFRMAVSYPLLDRVNDRAFKNKPFVERYVVHILIAVTLVHELAHCLYKYRRRDRLLRRRSVREPRVDTSPDNELGFLFEKFLLGGEFGIGHGFGQNLFDGSRGLIFTTYPSKASSRRIECEVPDETILTLFHESTWESNAPITLYVLPGNNVLDHRTTDAMLGQFDRMSLRDVTSDYSQEEDDYSEEDNSSQDEEEYEDDEEDDEGEEDTDEDDYSQDEDEDGDGHDLQDHYNSPYVAGDDSEMDWEPT